MVTRCDDVSNAARVKQACTEPEEATLLSTLRPSVADIGRRGGDSGGEEDWFRPAELSLLTSVTRTRMTIHRAIIVLAGLSLGYGVIRAGVLPRRTGIVLIVGVVAVAASQGVSAPLQVLAAATRDLVFAGMGAALLATGATSHPRRRVRSGADHPLAS